MNDQGNHTQRPKSMQSQKTQPSVLYIPPHHQSRHSCKIFMEFYERSRRRKDGASSRKRPDTTRCKRHPKHRQAPGVCSLCLHEKLSKIYSDSSRSSSSSSSSSLSHMKYYDYSSGSSSSSSLSPSSSSGSSVASPVPQYQFERHYLLKSRSIAFVRRRRRKGDETNGDNKGGDDQKRLGFWSRLRFSRQGQKTTNNNVVNVLG